MQDIPAVTGKQLIRLFLADGWEINRYARHAVLLQKRFSDRTRIVAIPDKRAVLPPGTLGNILGPRASGIGKAGLRAMFERHGAP